MVTTDESSLLSGWFARWDGTASAAWAAWRALLSLLSLGRGRRIERRLPLAPSEVLVYGRFDAHGRWLEQELKNVRQFIRFGGARARRITDVRTLKDVRSDERPPGAWLILLSAKRGRERDLVEGLERHYRRLVRAGRLAADSIPVVTRVPHLLPSGSMSTPGRQPQILFSRALDDHLEISGQSKTDWGSGVTVGVLDEELGTLPAGPRANFEYIGVLKQERVEPGVYQPRLEQRAVGLGRATHGDQMLAAIRYLAPAARIRYVGYKKTDLRFGLHTISAIFLIHALEQLERADIINVSATFDTAIGDIPAGFEYVVAKVITETVERTGVRIVAAVGKRADSLDVLVSDVRKIEKTKEDPATKVGFPARHHDVVAVGALDAAGLPDQRDRYGGKEGSLHWVMPAGDQHSPMLTFEGRPVFRSSLACALFSGAAAALRSQQLAGPDGSQRSALLKALLDATKPVADTVSSQLCGRGSLTLAVMRNARNPESIKRRPDA